MKGRLMRIVVKKSLVMALVMSIVVMAFSSPPMAEEKTPSLDQATAVGAASSSQCQDIIRLLSEQDQKNSGEFRQIKRDISALTQKVAEPGISEILGGVGYIFGLFGVAAYVASRKRAGGGGK